LHRLALASVSRKRALNRLGELTSAGYLDRRSVELPGHSGLQSVYFLTSRGRTALSLRSEEASAWFAPRQWKLHLGEPSIPHQVITNRVCDWMGAHAIPEHLLPPISRRELGRRAKSFRRPDAVFEAVEGRDGNRLVWLEVDLGHYTRQRIIEKVEGYLEARQAGFMLIACPTDAREEWLVDVLVKQFTGSIWERLDVRTFQKLRQGGPPDGDEKLRPSSKVPTMFYES
jgi:hypothetical protein